MFVPQRLRTEFCRAEAWLGELTVYAPLASLEGSGAEALTAFRVAEK